MKSTKAMLFAICAGLMALMLGTQSFAATSVVSVKLWDTGPHSMDMLGKGTMHGMGMMGGSTMMGGKSGAASMGIDVAPRTIPAGEVTFEVTNATINNTRSAPNIFFCNIFTTPFFHGQN